MTRIITTAGASAFGIFFAQVAPGAQNWAEWVAQTGIAVAMISWFALRLEKRLEYFSQSNLSLSRSNYLLVISLRQSAEPFKEDARAGVKEVDELREKKP